MAEAAGTGGLSQVPNVRSLLKLRRFLAPTRTASWRRFRGNWSNRPTRRVHRLLLKV